jgi:hypothetical protein
MLKNRTIKTIQKSQNKYTKKTKAPTYSTTRNPTWCGGLFFIGWHFFFKKILWIDGLGEMYLENIFFSQQLTYEMLMVYFNNEISPLCDLVKI